MSDEGPLGLDPVVWYSLSVSQERSGLAPVKLDLVSGRTFGTPG